jgi:urease accessory protein
MAVTPIATTTTITTIITATMSIDPLALMRLQNWLSPAFPVGAYAYSHALERAVEAGWVKDRASLVEWLEADLRHGGGRTDGIFFAQAWRAAEARNLTALAGVAELAAAMRSTGEFALEATAQGTAFLATVRKAWPHPFLEDFAAALGQAASTPIPATLPIAAGSVCAVHGIPLDLAVPAFLQSWAANLINAGVRLVPLGQTDGQLAVAALEAAVAATARYALGASVDDIGSAAFMVDILSMQHETQYTRLFRS